MENGDRYYIQICDPDQSPRVLLRVKKFSFACSTRIVVSSVIGVVLRGNRKRRRFPKKGDGVVNSNPLYSS